MATTLTDNDDNQLHSFSPDTPTKSRTESKHQNYRPRKLQTEPLGSRSDAETETSEIRNDTETKALESRQSVKSAKEEGKCDTSKLREPKPKTTSSTEGVRIHAINVGQGDCILVEFYNQEYGTTNCYLIDGGEGHDITKNIANLNKKAADRNKQHTKNKLACLEACQCPKKLKAIIVTHPNTDHYRGVTKLIKWYCSQQSSFEADTCILATEAFFPDNSDDDSTLYKFQQQVKNAYIPSTEPKLVDNSLLTQAFGTQLQCYFNGAKGMLFARKQVSSDLERTPKKLPKANLTSIITTVNNDQIVLTGDSKDNVIEAQISLTKKKHVKIFQVPHHGSKKSSNKAFYTTFTADIYLISAGDHEEYDHPNAEVFQAIIHANVHHHKRKCIIVVTNSYRLRSEKLHSLPESWWKYVTIYHVNGFVDYQDKRRPPAQPQWVTIDPNPPIPQGVELQPEHMLTNIDKLVQWTPHGYIKMIESYKKEYVTQTNDVRSLPLFHQQHVTIQSARYRYRIWVDIIIAVPVPHKPWTKERLNICYILQSGLDGKSLDALFPNSSKTYYWHRYLDQRENNNKWKARYIDEVRVTPKTEEKIKECATESDNPSTQGVMVGIHEILDDSRDATGENTKRQKIIKQLNSVSRQDATNKHVKDLISKIYPTNTTYTSCINQYLKYCKDRNIRPFPITDQTISKVIDWKKNCTSNTKDNYRRALKNLKEIMQN